MPDELLHLAADQMFIVECEVITLLYDKPYDSRTTIRAL